MNKRVLRFACALVMLVMLLGFGTAMAEETRIPYTVGSVCVTVPVEWSESGHDSESGMTMYTFEFTAEDGQTCEGVLMGMDVGALLESMGMPASAMEDLSLEDFSGLLTSLLDAQTGEVAVESRTIAQREVVFMSLVEEEKMDAVAMFQVETNLAVVGVSVPPGQEAYANTLIEDMMSSVQLVNEQ